MFGYLQEFWGQIASTTISAWEYTDDWFKNIGNAVAGGVGNIFLGTLQVVVDFGLALGFIIENLVTVIYILLLPFKFIFTYLATFISSLDLTPNTTNLFTQNTYILEWAETIPLFTTLTTVIASLIILSTFFGIIKLVKSF